MNRLFSFLFLLLPLLAGAAPYTVESVLRRNRHDASNYVSNPDGVLSPATVRALNGIIGSLEAETQAEVAVVAVQSIGQEDIKDFAVRLFEAWGIGKAGADNGLLVLLVPDQRKVTFETGYGIEGVLPDALCMRIIQQDMLPHFRQGDYDAGMLAGVRHAASILREEPVAVPQEEPVDWGVAVPIAIGAYLVLMLAALMWMHNLVRAVKHNPRLPNNVARYHALKAQKAGVISIMAVVLPVAALLAALLLMRAEYALLVLPAPLMALPANGYARWQMRRLRHAPIPCEVCGGQMHILSEKDEDQYLSLAQQFEEQLSAVDYDVFLCDHCHNTAVLTLDQPSSYAPCPRCGTKAFIRTGKRTLVAPTYLSTGVEQTTYRCKFCGYEEHHNTKLPRLQRTSGADVAGAMMMGSILRGGGGGFGGGFGGGGSFGGGSSGGGGATGGW